MLNTTILTRELLLAQREQLAEQHRQPAVAGQRDDLQAGVGGLGADGVRQRVGHGPVVERADQPAGAVHPHVARRPDARGADVDGEDRIRGGQLVDRGGDVLRVQRRAVAAGPGQMVQPGPGTPVMLGHPVQVRRIGLGLEQRQQRVNRVLDRADQRHPHLHPLADLLAPHVDLDHRDPVREERPVGEVGAEHDQRVAVLHGPVPGAESDQPGHPHVVGVVVLHELLAAERVHRRGLQRSGQRDELVVRAGAARPGQDRHRAGVVQHLRGGRQRLLLWADDRRGGPDRIRIGTGRGVGEEHLAGHHDHTDPAAGQ